MNLVKISGAAMRASWTSPHWRLAIAPLLAASTAFCSQPALADQNLMVADNGTVHCDASLKDLTRISLKGDQFASVSKVQTGNPAEDFQVVNEPLRGDIYLSVATGFDRPTLSFFGITRKGFVYKFVCTVAGDDAKQVFLANADLEQPQALGERIPANLPPQEAAARLIAAMYAQQAVEGYDIDWRALAPVNVGTLRVQLVGQYVGAALTGKLLKLSNPGTKPVTLTEDQVGPSDAVAISITDPKLEPGQATTAFVVVRKAEQGGRP